MLSRLVLVRGRSCSSFSDELRLNRELEMAEIEAAGTAEIEAAPGGEVAHWGEAALEFIQATEARSGDICWGFTSLAKKYAREQQRTHQCHRHRRALASQQACHN